MVFCFSVQSESHICCCFAKQIKIKFIKNSLLNNISFFSVQTKKSLKLKLTDMILIVISCWGRLYLIQFEALFGNAILVGRCLKKTALSNKDVIYVAPYYGKLGTFTWTWTFSNFNKSCTSKLVCINGTICLNYYNFFYGLFMLILLYTSCPTWYQYVNLIIVLASYFF